MLYMILFDPVKLSISKAFLVLKLHVNKLKQALIKNKVFLSSLNSYKNMNRNFCNAPEFISLFYNYEL